MAKKIFVQPDGTDITPYPFDGALDEATITDFALTVLDDADAATMLATLGGISGVGIEQAGVAVTGSPFTTINFASGATLLQSGGDVNQVDVTITGTSDTLGPDGDKGDITVGGTGTTLTIDNDAVTYAKMQNVSAASRVLGRGSAGGAGDPEEITLGTNLSMSATTLNGVASKKITGVTFDGGGSTPTVGTVGYVVVPFNGTIDQWHIVADASGSAVVDVWKAAGSIPTNGNTIAGSEKPTLSAQQLNSDTSLGTWTTTVSAGDVFGFELESVTTCTRITVEVRITESA